MTITIPPDLEGQLAEVAASLGTSPEQFALQSIWAAVGPLYPAPKINPEGRNLLEYLGTFVGAVEGPVRARAADQAEAFDDYLAAKHGGQR